MSEVLSIISVFFFTLHEKYYFKNPDPPLLILSEKN